MLRTLILDSGFTGPVSCHIDLVDGGSFRHTSRETTQRRQPFCFHQLAPVSTQYQDFEARGDHFRKIVNQYPQ